MKKSGSIRGYQETTSDRIAFDPKKLSKSMPISGLEIDTSIDLSKMEDFGVQKVDLVGAASKVKPVDEKGLQIDADMGKLDEGIRKLQAQQANQKVAQLLEKAQALLKSGKPKEAIAVLDQALGIDPSSAEAHFFKGYCLFSMDSFEPAMESLDRARGFARSADLFMLILILMAACMRAMNEAIAQKIQKLLNSKKYKEALALAETYLRQQPQNPAFHYHRAGILMLMERYQDAESSVRQSLGIFKGEQAEPLMQLLEVIRWNKNQHLVAKARTSLRAGRNSEALSVLQSCRKELEGVALYDGALALAYELGGPTGLAALFKRDKPRPVKDEARQKVLQWLLADELNAGVEALAKEKYAVAVQQFSQAYKIHRGCGVVCFLLALALMRQLEQSFETEKQHDLDHDLGLLQSAYSAVSGAFTDAEIAPQAQGLQKSIRGYLDQFEEIKRQQAREMEEFREIQALIDSYNSLMDEIKRHPIDSLRTLEAYERRFREIRTPADRLRRSRKPERGGKVMGELCEAIDRNLAQLEEIRPQARSSQAVEKINEVMKTYNAVMEFYQDHPISTREDLKSAIAMLNHLKSMVKDAYKCNPDYQGREILDQLSDAIDRNLRALER